MHHLILITSARYASVGTDYLQVSVCHCYLQISVCHCYLQISVCHCYLQVSVWHRLPSGFRLPLLPYCFQIQLPTCRPACCRCSLSAAVRCLLLPAACRPPTSRPRL
ncbi:hypothetical protein [Methanimicrococcus hacksteinii]|uniref:hypothetical protein n=1 Tax=Methanimicrococcus hacksteinii TaxID=3028293 RepID=UPI00298F1976|nr:hypothetical protein [Methanimicrococcus sp. At1]